MSRDNQITIGYNRISGEYIFEHGQESLMVLALLSRHYSIRKEFVFNMRYLYNKLGIPLNKKERKDGVLKSINSMFKTDFDSNINVNDILTIPHEIERDQYLIMTDSEVDCILNYDKRIDKYSLFNTYATIKRHVNYYKGVAYPSIKTLMFNTNVVSNNTIMKYIHILEDLGMIICTRKDEYIVNDNGVKRPNNEYKLI